jgi:hypothetical protein
VAFQAHGSFLASEVRQVEDQVFPARLFVVDGLLFEHLAIDTHDQLPVAAIIGGSYPYVVLKLGFGPNISVVSASQPVPDPPMRPPSDTGPASSQISVSPPAIV